MPAGEILFQKYLSPVFVETGSYLGDGIQQAINAGFEKIISIELSDKYFSICKKKFENNSNVTLIKGDSAFVLYDVIKDIDSKITFWLDGHHSCGDTALGAYWAPLMQELDAIKKHKRNDHIILIDDMRCWNVPNPIHGFSESDLVSKIKEIRNDYFLTREDSPVMTSDILVATLL